MSGLDFGIAGKKAIVARLAKGWDLAVRMRWRRLVLTS